MVKTTVGIEGMACSMCESHINDAIRRSFQVKKVTSSRSSKESVIISENEIPESDIRKVIGETGYQVTSVSSEPYEKKGLFSRHK